MSYAGAQQRQLLAALAKAAVDFVIVGGHAVAAHGFERGTGDVDIVFSTDLASCEKFAATLRELGASITIADIPPSQGQITAEWLSQGGHFVFATNRGSLDALSWIAGFDYDALSSRSETAELADGLRLRVCSYEDLAQMKRIANRPRDKDDLAELEAIRKRDAEEG